MRTFTLTLALAGVGAIPAAAQTVDGDPYSGVYVGGSIGVATQSSNGNERVLFDRNLDGGFGDTVTTAAGANAFGPGFCPGAPRGNAAALGCDNSAGDSDIEYYGRVGIDHQFGNIVVGALVEAGKPEITDYVTAFSTTPASYTFRRKIDFNGSFRARLGYAADRTLFYATGGGAYARIDNDFTSTNTANTFTGNDDKDDAWGFTAGGGVEQRVGALSFGLEYLYTQYRNDDFRVRVGQGTAPATNPFVLAPNTTGTDLRRSDDRFDWHSIRATAAFRF